jgi:hypothetical protein
MSQKVSLKIMSSKKSAKFLDYLKNKMTKLLEVFALYALISAVLFSQQNSSFYEKVLWQNFSLSVGPKLGPESATPICEVASVGKAP